MSQLKIIIVGILFLLPLAALAQQTDLVCAPTSMIKIVTKDNSPGLPDDAFTRQPKTLYRFADKFGRIEEMYNPETGQQLLIVVNEPDVWVADKKSRKAQHLKDPGPTYFFRAPIFGPNITQSEKLFSLELGCEVPTMQALGAQRRKESIAPFGNTTVHEFTENNEVVKLITVGKLDEPKRLEYWRDGQLHFVMDYIEYNTGLRPEEALFAAPTGYEMIKVEAAPQSAPKSE